MASLIINEGSGPRSVDLRGPVVIGSNPSCDVVLDHPTATGCRVELVPKRFGYRVTKLKGELLVNEQAADMADLEHNDTLRIGEVLLLYKQPEGDAFDADGTPSAVASVERLPDGSEDEVVGDLFDDEIEALEPLEAEPAPGSELDDALERARLKRLEALRRLQLAEHGASIDELPDLSAPGALLEAAALDVDDELALEALAHEHGLEEATFREILAAADRAASSHDRDQPLEIVELEELPLEPPPEIDEALVRAQLKRLAALDVLVRAGAGAPREPLPDLSDARVLDAMRALRDAGGAEALLAYERAERLEDEPPRLILERADALWTEREARAAAEVQARLAAEAAAAEQAQRAEFEALEEVSELETLDEVEGLEQIDELEELAELEALDELAIEDLPEAPVAPTPAAVPPLAPRAVTAPARRAPAAPSRAPAQPARVPQPVSAGWRVAAPAASGALPAGARPLPPEGIVFTRPLPPGRAAPAYLPPVHPGSPRA